jgi:hypothetical protein
MTKNMKAQNRCSTKSQDRRHADFIDRHLITRSLLRLPGLGSALASTRKITGQRLDTHEPPVVVTDHGNGAWIEGRPYYFITAGVPLPGAGCCQITARLYGAEIKFVVWLDQ